MARPRVVVEVQDARGNAVGGNLLTFYQKGTTTPLADDLYRTETGTSTYATSDRRSTRRSRRAPSAPDAP